MFSKEKVIEMIETYMRAEHGIPSDFTISLCETLQISMAAKGNPYHVLHVATFQQAEEIVDHFVQGRGFLQGFRDSGDNCKSIVFFKTPKLSSK